MHKETKTKLIQALLFVVTVFTTTLVGAEYGNFETVKVINNGKEISENFWAYFTTGLYYSIPFLGVLTVHEFGHFFTAKHHKLPVSLPYYIPLWFPGLFSFGTMGAVIKLKAFKQTKLQFFDVGIAGPLAGFVAALLVLWYGFTNLPPYQEITSIHPEYIKHIDAHGANYINFALEEAKTKGVMVLSFGDNILFWLFKNYVAPNPENVPAACEIMHYPFLMAGYLALFFTALNLLPIGQLDGGHILYGLFGKKKSDLISQWVFTAFVTWAGIGFISPYVVSEELVWKVPLYGFFMYFLFTGVFESKTTALTYGLGVFAFQFSISALLPDFEGYNGWLVFALIISKVLGIKHPQAYIEEPLDLNRKILGWIALIIFVLCFSPRPFMAEIY